MYGIEGLLAGKTLVGRYRIDEVIGRGGMGAVYRARDLRLGRPVAVKVISVAVPDEQAHQRLRARFQREARAAAGLHHPNVVDVYDYGTDEELGLDFLVMELLRGEDLAVHLARKGPPTLFTSLHILYQAARGLGAGHRAGLIHRDVKPGNLFLEPGDRPGEVQVRVLDFGIAEISALEEETMTHLTVVGRSPFSPAYASPEQLNGEPVTAATDVFSLGAVGFQLVTGRRAFSTGDPREQYAQIQRGVLGELSRVQGLPTAVRIAVERALSRSPQDRFPNAGAFAEAIALGLPSDPTALELGASGERSAEEDRTLLAPEDDEEEDTYPVVPGPPRRIEVGTRFVTPAAAAVTGESARTSLDSLPPPRPVLPPFTVARVAPAPAPSPSATYRPATAPAAEAPPPRRSWARGAIAATWSFLVTITSFALFGGAWLTAVTALRENEFDSFYLASAATVVFTPFALHRLMGSRGSLRFALFATILASIATYYALADDQDAETVLAALFMAQLLAAVFAEILTRTPARFGPEDDLEMP